MDRRDKTEGGGGLRRAAAFLLALDSETAALVMQQMNEREIAELSDEMSRLGELSGPELEATLKDWTSAASVDRLDTTGAVQQLFEKAFGKERGRDLLDRSRSKKGPEQPFVVLRALDAKQIQLLIREEHPQVQALVIAYLDPPVAAQLIKDMDEDLRYDVVRRMASTEDLPIESMRQVEASLEKRALEIGRAKSPEESKARFKTVAQVLTAGEPEITKAIIERLAQDAPTDANEVQALMFVFEDILKIPDKDMQKVLAEVDKADLVLALKAAPQEIADKIMGNLSARARENMKEEIEMLGPRPLSEVEEAQKRMLTQIRAMEERGDIKVVRGSGEVMV
jgi:flagellar motor switch protein FliG